MSHELFLTIRQKTKIRNVFAENISTDVKLNKAQISKIIQSAGFLCSIMSDVGSLDKNMAKGAIINLDVLLAKDFLPGLVSNMASNVTSKAIDKLEKN